MLRLETKGRFGPCYAPQDMAANSVPELLAAQSKAKLRAMEQALDEQIADLKIQKQWVGKALLAKGGGSKPTVSAGDKASGQNTGRKTGSTEMLRQIIKEQPERVWMPKDVIDAANEKGISSTDAAIRVALRRMYERGFLERGPDGTGWKLASSNGSAGESSSEAQTSGPVGMGG